MNQSNNKVEHYEVPVISAEFVGLIAGIHLKMTDSTNSILSFRLI